MILHTVSIWYTLVLAVWRLIMIKYHTKAITYCTLSRCNTLLVLGYGISKKQSKYNALSILLSVVPLVLTIPNTLAMSVKGMTTTTSRGNNLTIYSLTVCKLQSKSSSHMFYNFSGAHWQRLTTTCYTNSMSGSTASSWSWSPAPSSQSSPACSSGPWSRWIMLNKTFI